MTRLSYSRLVLVLRLAVFHHLQWAVYSLSYTQGNLDFVLSLIVPFAWFSISFTPGTKTVAFWKFRHVSGFVFCFVCSITFLALRQLLFFVMMMAVRCSFPINTLWCFCRTSRQFSVSAREAYVVCHLLSRQMSKVKMSFQAENIHD